MKLEAQERPGKERPRRIVGGGVADIDKSGKVTLNGWEFEFTAKGPVQIKGGVIDLN